MQNHNPSYFNQGRLKELFCQNSQVILTKENKLIAFIPTIIILGLMSISLYLFERHEEDR